MILIILIYKFFNNIYIILNLGNEYNTQRGDLMARKQYDQGLMLVGALGIIAIIVMLVFSMGGLTAPSGDLTGQAAKDYINLLKQIFKVPDDPRDAACFYHEGGVVGSGYCHDCEDGICKYTKLCKDGTYQTVENIPESFCEDDAGSPKQIQAQ